MQNCKRSTISVSRSIIPISHYPLVIKHGYGKSRKSTIVDDFPIKHVQFHYPPQLSVEALKCANRQKRKNLAMATGRRENATQTGDG